MIAYKGFNEHLWSKMGDGQKETCKFFPGETKTVKKSKTARSGFHCCEYILGCMKYYPMDGKNRFFEVIASGDIDEDGAERIACTTITLAREIKKPLEIAVIALRYIVNHPDRDWEIRVGGATAERDRCEAINPGDIAIARGRHPAARGPEGSIIGIVVDNKKGIQAVKMVKVTSDIAGRWITVGKHREVLVL